MPGKQSRLARCIALPAALLAIAAQAQAYTIDFGNGPASPVICTPDFAGLGPAQDCGSTATPHIVQTYGDVAGVSNITYANLRADTPTSLRWWDVDYSNLYGVAYAYGSDADSHGRIDIQAVQPGAVVTLQGFDLGAYNQTSRDTQVSVFALGSSTPLFTFNGAVGNEATGLATTFLPNISAVGGLRLEWSDSAYNVGIDNIQYSVSAVPEPAAAVLMLAGALGLAGARRAARAGGASA